MIAYVCDSLVHIDENAAIVQSRNYAAHEHFLDVQTQFPACSPFDTFFLLHIVIVRDGGMAETAYGKRVKLIGPQAEAVRAGSTLLARQRAEGVEPVLVWNPDGTEISSARDKNETNKLFITLEKLFRDAK